MEDGEADIVTWFPAMLDLLWIVSEFTFPEAKSAHESWITDKNASIILFCKCQYFSISILIKKILYNFWNIMQEYCK